MEEEALPSRSEPERFGDLVAQQSGRFWFIALRPPRCVVRLMDIRQCGLVPMIRPLDLFPIAHHAIVPGIDPALIATTAAWAVFGAARRWHHTANRIPAEEMAAKIETMVKPLFLNSFQ